MRGTAELEINPHYGEHYITHCLLSIVNIKILISAALCKSYDLVGQDSDSDFITQISIVPDSQIC